MQKKNKPYKGHLPYQSEFDRRFVFVNHNAWAKVKRFNKRLAKRREKRTARETASEDLIGDQNAHNPLR